MQTLCPYCEHPLAVHLGRTDCPQCGRQVFNVACPTCTRRTLNLTLMRRYGKLECFYCHTVQEKLPGVTPPQETVIPAAPKLSTYTPRAPKSPVMPTADEARQLLEESLLGLERAAQDRELLRVPELRVIVQQYLELLQDALDWDAQCADGTVTDAWLRDSAQLAEVDRLCIQPFWSVKMTMLPAATQSWALAVDDAARRWQYARRTWLVEEFGLTPLPILPGVTTFDAVCHHRTGDGEQIAEVLSQGYLLRGVIVRKAWVRTISA